MTLRYACRIAALVLCLTCGAVAAQAEEPETSESLPTFAELEAAGAVIGRIHVNPQQIFNLDDPREAGWFYRLANQLHFRTRPETIERQLLFKPGDYVSVRVIDETERLLRSGRFLHDVQIRPVAYYGGVVDIEVLTRDSWSLEPGVSVARSGGVNSSRSSLIEAQLPRQRRFGRGGVLEATSIAPASSFRCATGICSARARRSTPRTPTSPTAPSGPSAWPSRSTRSTRARRWGSPRRTTMW